MESTKKKAAKSSSLSKQLDKMISCKSYVCTICNQIFPRYQQMIDHRKCHKGEKHLPCKICGRQFAMKSNLLRHFLRHEGTKSYACDICGKQFVTDSNLASHMRIHKTRKKYRCSVCDMIYLSGYSLKRHMLLHAGSKEFSCAVCSKDFSSKCALKAHLKTHEGEGDKETYLTAKPYPCSVCGKRFTQECYLVRHERYHNYRPYSCTLCGKGFVNNCELKKHSKVHEKNDVAASGTVLDKTQINESEANDPVCVDRETYLIAKPYLCNKCGKRFTLKSYLLRHEKYHAYRPYSCTLCGKGFVNRCELKKHARVHGKEDVGGGGEALTDQGQINESDIVVKEEELEEFNSVSGESSHSSTVDFDTKKNVKEEWKIEIPLNSAVSFNGDKSTVKKIVRNECRKEKLDSAVLEPLAVFIKDSADEVSLQENYGDDLESDVLEGRDEGDPLA